MSRAECQDIEEHSLLAFPGHRLLRPDVRLFVVEHCNADGCYRSKVSREQTPNPHLDGIRTSIGATSTRDLVDDMLTITEDEIKLSTHCYLLPARPEATQLVRKRMKLLGRGGGRALPGIPGDAPEARDSCITLCGGNVDLGSLAWLMGAQGKEAAGNEWPVESPTPGRGHRTRAFLHCCCLYQGSSSY
ncbi:PREDICTED: serine racemase [Gavialis gangeticus]|uniref:serine racemase n=1 Tax=Gavialis gangeticus TaxID=94835 RepID=UPI00092F83B8|nr:PREDICTED: serine racemase [Gavialis gangeticus]